jgi:3-oxosteroid 1-dehydrogenase
MAEQTEEQSFDIVIVGSGGGGLAAALAAHVAGLKPVIVEKQNVVGGSTGMSGGMLWIPDNPMMKADGIKDSYQDGLDYLQAVIGDPDEPSSVARRNAFLTNGPRMISFLQEQGLKFFRSAGYSDYYDNYQGGSVAGRSVEGIPWDGRQLGDWQHRIVHGLGEGVGLAVTTLEIHTLNSFTHTLGSFLTTARVVLRTYLSRLRGQDLFTNGKSFAGQMTKILLDQNVPIWLNTAVEDLVVEDGRVVGVRAVRDGAPVVIRGRRGVLLSAGGYERNAEMRLKYTAATQPSDGQWTWGNPGNTGEVLAAAIALGAKTEYMDEAIWLPSPRKEMGGSTLTIARQYPHALFVNKSGKRFVNEANSYVEVGRAMYANDSVPCWLIFDDAYRRSVPWVNHMPKFRNLAAVIPGRLPEQWLTNGWIKRADTIEDLARLIELDPQALADTVSHFNAGAAAGTDQDFGRGVSQYNHHLGDPGHKPNPSLGPVADAPFYAVPIYPGDVGTMGGVVCDEHARVLDHDNQPIPGLYAAGNMAASVFGRTYPGAGASIANTTVFGYIAARHMADAGQP